MSSLGRKSNGRTPKRCFIISKRERERKEKRTLVAGRESRSLALCSRPFVVVFSSPNTACICLLFTSQVDPKMYRNNNPMQVQGNYSSLTSFAFPFVSLDQQFKSVPARPHRSISGSTVAIPKPRNTQLMMHTTQFGLIKMALVLFILFLSLSLS